MPTLPLWAVHGSEPGPAARPAHAATGTKEGAKEGDDQGADQGAEAACAGPLWSTSSFGHPCDTSPVELHALGSHLLQCQGGNTGLRALQRATQAVHGFVAPRFVSTLAVLVLGGGALLLLW